MFRWFHRQKGHSHCTRESDNWHRPERATQLLSPAHRQALIQHIWQHTAVSQDQFATLYLAPLERYAELVQHFPASENHHHAHPGGLLDHGLEIVLYALKLRQSHLLPSGAPPEVQNQQAQAWTAAVTYAALLHDIGKLVTDLVVEDHTGKPWHPWHGPLQIPYRFHHNPDRQYRSHSAATGLLTVAVIGRAPLDWLSAYPDIWAALLHSIAGQYEHAGILGELVIRADQASTAQAMGGNPMQALAAPKHALQRKLLDGLRYLLHEVLKLNGPEASDGWLTEDALWLVSKTATDKLRAHLLSLGIAGIPERNTTLFNILQEHGLVLSNTDGKAIWRATVQSPSGWIQTFTMLKLAPALIWELDHRPPTFAGDILAETTNQPPEAPATDNPTPALPAQPQPSPGENHGAQFLDWLRDGIRQRRLVLNTPVALLHTVDGTLFLVSPGIFRRYLHEHPEIAKHGQGGESNEWQALQKQFEQLGLHRKRENDLNLWTCEVCGPPPIKRLHGYLLLQPERVIGEVAFDNPYLRLVSG